MPGVSSRSKIVGVRIPLDLLAKLPKGNRNAAIVDAIREKYQPQETESHERTNKGTDGVSGRKPKRNRHGSAVPILRDTASAPERLHALQPVRDELAGRRGPIARPQGEPTAPVCTNPKHRRLPNGRNIWCVNCGCNVTVG